MKLLGMISAAALSLTLGLSVPAFAQEQHDQQEAKHGDEAKPTQQDEKHAQQDEKKGQEKPAQQEEKKAQQEDKKTQAEKPAAQHEQQAQHTNGKGGRIPDDRFRANFGREHVFVINRPIIVEGRPRFQYGGYWFGFGQVWPVGWYYTDNVYVDYIDGGYYLYNPVHPGIRIVINVI